MSAPERFGHYELLSRLSTGGMAVTWLARRDGVPTAVALKRVLPNLTSDPELRELFIAEAELARRLVHPNVVRTTDAGESEGELYLEMDYVWGEDLRRVAKAAAAADVRLSARAMALVAADAARGLGYAHGACDAEGRALRIVHRDVSPPNIMVRFDGVAVVVDFGIAKVARRFQRARAGQLKGKFAYMSPEQVEGLAVDARSDVFSLGVILWEFTLHRRLFRAESDLATIAAVAATSVPPPRDLDPDYPPALQAIVLRALAQDPDRRYSDATELAAALDAWLGDDADAARAELVATMRSLFAQRIDDIARTIGVGYSATGPLTSTVDAEPLEPELGPGDDGSPTSAPMTESKPEREGGEDESPSATAADDTAADDTAADDTAADDTASVPTAAAPGPPVDPYDASEPESDAFSRSNTTSRAVFALVAIAIAVLVGVMAVKASRSGLGTSYLSSYTPPPPMLPSEREVVEPPGTVSTAIRSTPPGAAIVVNGVAWREVTPTDVPIFEGFQNVISLHHAGYVTHFADALAGHPVSVELEPVVRAPVEPADTVADSDGAAPTAEEGAPEPGFGRVVVRATDTAGEPVDAEVLLNGVRVGVAPVTVDVPAGQDQHVTARRAGLRDTAAYVRAIEWRDEASSRFLDLEMTVDSGEDNRLTSLRIATTPASVQVRVGDEHRVGSGLLNVRSPLPHRVVFTAPDHEPMVRAVDGRLGQMVFNAILAPLRREPGTLTIETTPPETTVYLELIRHGSAGARQIPSPVVDRQTEAGPYRLTLEHNDGERRVRGRFEIEVLSGEPALFRYALEDGAFVAVQPD